VILPVTNRMYGETVTTAGLLPGQDIAAALTSALPSDIVLIPAESLDDNNVFVDDYAFADLRAAFPRARVVAAHELTGPLRGLAEPAALELG
jgi:hypothetical protein